MIRSELEAILGPEAVSAMLGRLRLRKPFVAHFIPDEHGLLLQLTLFPLTETVRRRKCLTPTALPA